ncbi:hypothetical protein KR200_010182, partial [Drosophila serrata]
RSSYKMFPILRLSAPKISALILKWTFYYSKLFGVSYFHLKTTTEGKLQVEDANRRWKWFHASQRLAIIITFSYLYIYWIFDLNDLTEITLHIVRLINHIFCSLCLLRLQLLQGQEIAELINRFLKLSHRVQDICHHQNQKPKRIGFGGKQELILLSIMMIGIIHEKIFIISIFQIVKGHPYLFGWILEVFISIGNILLMHFFFLWYLALGLQYADLNEYVRTEMRSQLETLEAKPTRKKLREARMTLDKCLKIHQDLLSLTSQFQRIYDLIFCLSLIYNCAEVAVFSYKIVVQLELDWFFVWSETVFKILNMLILCLAVQRAMLQFKVIRGLMLENCYLSDNKDWHRTLDMFLTHLTLHELRVCPLGLFKVSNELLLVFLSALVNYFTVVIQYGLQQSVV